MATEEVEKAKRIKTMNESEAAQLKAMEAEESCPTCGSPMKAMPAEPAHKDPEYELGPEQGGKHTMMGALTRTNFPGYKTRRLKQGERIGGGY